MEKEKKKLTRQQKIDTQDIAIQAEKLTSSEKEHIYFIIKGMQISKKIEEIEELKKA